MMRAIELQKKIRALANPSKAKVLAGFFKTDKGQYAEGDKFLGVTVPEVRKLVLAFGDEIDLLEVKKILESKFHEERLLAVLILVKKFEKGTFAERNKILKIYFANTDKINNWDLVDLSADKIVGRYARENKREKLIRKLAKSNSLWERRIAMVATFNFIKNGQSDLALEMAETLLFDEHDLIQKAVGWMLREVGKRCSRGELENFLQKHACKMPRTTLRYAIEHFLPDQRSFYLGLKNAKMKP